MEYTKISKKVLHTALIESQRFGHSYVGTEHILLGLLIEKNNVANTMLVVNGVDEFTVRKMIEQNIDSGSDISIMDASGYSPSARRILKRAEEEAEAMRADKVGTEHILMAILKDVDCLAIKILNTIKGANTKKMYVDLLNTIGLNDKSVNIKKFDPMSNTPILDQFSKDLTEYAKHDLIDPVIGKDKEINRVIQILSRRTKNNPCLIGEPGVGKTSIAEGLAILINKGQVPDTIKDMRVVSLDMGGMVAGTKYRGEFEERIKRIIDELSSNKNIILFIDEIHTIIGAGGAEGALDAANILKPALARGDIQVIGATTIDEYRKHIEKDAALERRFQTVEVKEPSEEESIEILKGLRKRYETFHKIAISDEAIVAATKLSVRYIPDRNLPDKAIDLIDEACSKLKIKSFDMPKEVKDLAEEIKKLETEKEKLISKDMIEEASEVKKKQLQKKYKYDELVKDIEDKRKNSELKIGEEDIADVVAGWTKIPVKKLTEDENEKLMHLEDTLHKRVIGQDDAINIISKAIRRNRVGIKDPNRPIGTFLFLGPTGVGKTELCKAISDTLFGSDKNLIRLDMSEYMEKYTVSKLIGSPPGYVGHDEGGQLTEKIRRNPYSVVLFDEIEKADQDIFNVLLQVLDEGHMTDSMGRKVSFKNSIIIMTSNVGANRIVDNTKPGFSTLDEDKERDYSEMKDNVIAEVKKMFKPEFINRIDDIIVFHKLSKDEISKILDLNIRELKKITKENINIDFKIDKTAKELILEKGYKDEFGARELKRTLTSMLTDLIAEEKLKGNINAGDSLNIVAKNDKLVIKKENE
ncbi:MAG: ATP-dependent Clp protease ATP-binding subunit [Lachnospiraceae bacterium]|nr:ATP-dependent Clp protease ATP-binding subunit [Lachnospiraceae bacterium]